jgi:curved DNA-binding protein
MVTAHGLRQNGLLRAQPQGTAMEFKDYYKILGVAKTATADEIKKAYRKLARKYHPDVSKEPDAQARMAELNEAQAVLSDPEKRVAYDALGSQPPGQRDFRPPPNWDAGFEFSDGAGGGAAGDYSDFFEQLFGRARQGAGSAGGARGHRREPQPERGTDHHAKIELDLLDVYNGAERNISLRGAKLDDSGHMVTEDRTLNVKIPKGVIEGQQIRLSGQGGPGHAGGPAGDLFLEVHFKPDPRWRVQGRDVTASLPLAPWEAALGAEIEVPTPTSRVQVTVPAGWKKGRKLRLKGHGIPARSASDPAGDLYLELELALPPADTAKARELYETMARELPFDARAGL